MATYTRAQVAERALEALGAKAAGQDALPEDQTRALEVFDAVYARLRKEGLAPFAESEVPDWAQTQFVHLIAFDLIPTFGVSGERVQVLTTAKRQAELDLARQVAGYRHPIPIRSVPF